MQLSLKVEPSVTAGTKNRLCQPLTVIHSAINYKPASYCLSPYNNAGPYLKFPKK